MSDYFSKVPNFEYVSRLPDAHISDYITVKNLFKRGALEPDILENLALHTKYKIRGDDRPDNVAYDYYESSELDWLVLTCNNIINVQTEWPMLQNDYETLEVKNSLDVIIIPKGLQCESDYTITYFDSNTQREVTVLSADCTTEITNLVYEEKIEDNKRDIYLLKPKYLSVIKDDMEIAMTYRKGSTQYMSETLKKAANIKLYQ